MIKAYLAGAIRDGHQEDIDWREAYVLQLGHKVQWLNPLAGKTYDAATKTWKICGISPTGSFIVRNDFAMVDRSDFFVFNLLCLADGYPALGTLTEFGRATSRVRPVFTIWPENMRGHSNAIYRMHPFIELNSTAIFKSPWACLEFLKEYVPVMTGENARYERLS